MSSTSRWEHCILNRASDVAQFVHEYLKGRDPVCLIAGAGFDPRTTAFASLLADEGVNAYVLLFREERPTATKLLRSRAEANLLAIRAKHPSVRTEELPVFNEYNLLVGGRRAVEIVASLPLETFTDIFLDCSALSRGITFPIARFLLDRLPSTNIHLITADEPATDDAITAVLSDKASFMLGYRGPTNGGIGPEPARLWLPQLVLGQRRAYELIHDSVKPHDVCPILPFPCSDPKLPDRLLEEFAIELQQTWNVDARSIVYAHESDPIDLYRSILRLHHARERIFRETRGSEIVLSPLGSKLLSLGAMLAAIEHDFPVVYVEAVEYKVNFTDLDAKRASPGPLVHLWLQGEVYV